MDSTIHQLTKAEIKRMFLRVNLVSIKVQRADDMSVRTSKAALIEALNRYSEDSVYEIVILDDGQGGEMIFLGFADTGD
jgi:hypothetical protein